MSNNNNNSRKNNNGKNGNGNNTTQKKGKRSAAAIARRTAKWASQKAAKKSSALEKHHAEKEAKEAERKRKEKRVLDLFPDVMSIVGAQGFMPNIVKVKQTSKTMKTKLEEIPLFQNADRATVYPGHRTLLGHYMSKRNWPKTLETLKLGVSKKVLETHIHYDNLPLTFAFQARNLEVFKALLEKGANPNVDVLLGRKEKPLISYIISTPDTEDTLEPYVKELLKYKVNVNKLSHYGEHPLDEAIITKANKIAKLLIENGAKLEIPNKAGFTPVLTAISLGNREMLELMKKKGIDMDKKTGEKVLFPLKIAVTNGTVEILEDVLEDVKNVNAKDKAGNTALHYAVMTKSFPKIALLITKGANPRISNEKGKTAFDLARDLELKGNARVYDLLKDI